jgi:hemerythrin-like domain-containing protein
LLLKKEIDMDPIRALMSEHRFIERFLEAARGCAARLADSRAAAPPRSDLARIAEFIRGYADAYHHGKEEEILFAAMLAHGFSDTTGPLAVMLADHAAGRQFTGVVRDIGSREGTLTAAERREAADALGGYANLLSAHIWKEDQVLYPMAHQALKGEAWEEVCAKCAAFDAAREAEEEPARLRLLGEELIAAYGGVRA